MDVKTRRFWPRLFSSGRKKTATQTEDDSEPRISAEHNASWQSRPYANSSASAATAVGTAEPEYASDAVAVTPDGTLSTQAPLLLRALPMRTDQDVEDHIVTLQELAASGSTSGGGISNKAVRSKRLRRRKTVHPAHMSTASSGAEQFPPLQETGDIVAVTGPAHARNMVCSPGDADCALKTVHPEETSATNAGNRFTYSAHGHGAHAHSTAKDIAALSAPNSKHAPNSRRSNSEGSNAGDNDADDDDGDCPAVGEFWTAYDRTISQGGDASSQRPRAIVDAMVDDIVSLSGGVDGWRVAEGCGTFNDVLSNVGAIHPIVLTFARAHVENAFVCLGAEHIWLAIVQGVAAMVRKIGGMAPSSPSHDDNDGGDFAGAGGADLVRLWNALRKSSPIPTSVLAATGHEIRLFPTDAYTRHLVYPGHGAAPVAMAAAAAASTTTAAKSGDVVQFGHIRVGGGRRIAWQPRKRSTNPAWIQALKCKAGGVRGLCLTGSFQGWSSLCILARQLKETYSGRARTFDWWLHRMHLLCCDLADYFAAQDEFAESGVPTAWQKWFSMALFDGHSGAPQGERMDGWLSALFAVDAFGEPVHSKECWSMDWEAVPSGVDLMHLPNSALNIYSGFVGVQQLCRDPAPGANHPLRTRNQSSTLHGEDLETALGLDADSSVRDRSSTLHSSQHDLPVSTANESSVKPTSGSAPVALAPVIGWALDK
ncbi:hypothetical protein EV175_005205 [Coemansia sp. RSA 1933]|nr:hypothetical protein EV175_005205 [Coemansia sp. RSA 1933]